MDDLISRQAVIDELNKWDWQELYLPIHFKENIIDVLPSAEKTRGKVQRMTIDEAILHAEEVADTPCFTDEEARCYAEHRQLAEWLKDYKRLLSAEKTGRWIDGKCDKCGNHAPYLAIAASTYFINYTDYCPNCGAKMIEPQERSE